jgi:nitrate reductase gamma subunit
MLLPTLIIISKEQGINMSTYINEFLFGLYPYLAGTVFIIGSLVRFEFAQYTWRSGSSQILTARSRRFNLGNQLFHVGILFLFFGHLVGLLTPHSVYHMLGLDAATKQKLAMIAGGIFGSVCLIGIGLLMHRRMLDDRIRATSSQGDIFILWLLMIQVVFGLMTIFVSAQHPDGSVMVLLGEWAQRIITFREGAAAAVFGVHWLYKVHLFLGITMFLVFPFTRLVHVWSAPLSYIGRTYQIVRQKRMY